jgi:hypothetical protein
MSSDSSSGRPRRPSFGFGNPIIIDFPPEPTSAGLAAVQIQPGCTINTSGRVDAAGFPQLQLLSISAHVGGAEQAGTVSGNTWEVDNVSRAFWTPGGLKQTVFVTGVFHDTSTNSNQSIPNQRDFLGTAGYASCQYSYTSPGGGSMPIDEIMPRHFRVSADFGGQHTFGLMAGGLLSQGALYLTYDPKASTPECPVWRDIGLPPSVGGWLLRVVRTGNCCYETRLSIQAATETCIMPPANFFTRNWSFRKRNLLHGSLGIGHANFDVTLIVEPS